ncbi:hypothetical protein, partial [Mesorhizobium sp.]|uniref:hypothetical protein n=1 Tax=Mesorhizobium sp. TaxID=1871066 RepID=UPI0025B88001
ADQFRPMPESTATNAVSYTTPVGTIQCSRRLRNRFGRPLQQIDVIDLSERRKSRGVFDSPNQ